MPDTEIKDELKPAASNHTDPLMEVFGVTERSYRTFHQGCRHHLDRIKESGSCVMKRPIRESVDILATTAEEILLNCEQDPDDMRVELGLPAIFKRIADQLDEYTILLARQAAFPSRTTDLSQIEEMITEVNPWLKDLLERMRSNDGQDVTQRARLMSQILQKREPNPPQAGAK